jgi:hypothetical protein
MISDGVSRRQVVHQGDDGITYEIHFHTTNDIQVADLLTCGETRSYPEK